MVEIMLEFIKVIFTAFITLIGAFIAPIYMIGVFYYLTISFGVLGFLCAFPVCIISGHIIFASFNSLIGNTDER